MAVKVGINGFGRIGRQVLKAIRDRYPNTLEVVAINDIGDLKTMAHLLKYDSNYGRFNGTVEVGEGTLTIDGKPIKMLKETELDKLPWKDFGVDIVIESTGLFTIKKDGVNKKGKTVKGAENHITKGGAKKVIISAPAKGADLTLCYGVNHTAYKKDAHHVISNASCTTNCLAPVAKVLHESFGIRRGLMTTVHSYTNDQRILDLPHEDLRRARAAALSMIPTTTGAAKAVGEVLPELKGKLDGMAIRVPTPNVSVVDLSAELNKSATEADINAAMQKAAAGPLKGVLQYCDEPLVSIDFNGNPHSSIFDALSTKVMDGNFVKILSWYDNEWGFSRRMCDVTRLIGGNL